MFYFFFEKYSVVVDTKKNKSHGFSLLKIGMVPINDKCMSVWPLSLERGHNVDLDRMFSIAFVDSDAYGSYEWKINY